MLHVSPVSTDWWIFSTGQGLVAAAVLDAFSFVGCHLSFEMGDVLGPAPLVSCAGFGPWYGFVYSLLELCVER